jgi:glucokinase
LLARKIIFKSWEGNWEMANRYAIGVDVGGTKILAGIVELSSGKVVASAKKKTVGNKEKDLANRIIVTIEDCLATANLSAADSPGSIGVGAAGQINRDRGELVFAPNLGAPPNYPIARTLSERFKLPVKLGNDVEVATVGELHFGAGKGSKNFVCVFVGTGIGGGIVQDGVIYRGSSGTAGEIGHIVVSAEGRLCGCGGRGHLEAYSSRTAITRTLLGELKRGKYSVLRDMLGEDSLTDPNSASSIAIRSKVIAQAMEADDPLVKNVLGEAAEFLGLGLASVINFYNPSRIILGGGLIEAVDSFFWLTVEEAKHESLPAASQSIEIVRTRLGDFSGVVGAAIIGQQ